MHNCDCNGRQYAHMSREKRENNELADQLYGLGVDDWGIRNSYGFWEQVWAEVTGTYDPRRSNGWGMC